MRRKNVTSETMKRYLVEALLQLMRDRPYGAISVGELARRAGVNRSTYYRHFGSKEDIVRCYFASVMREYQERFRAMDKPELPLYLRTLFETFRAHRQDLGALHRANLSFLLLDVLNASFHLEDILESASAERKYRTAYHTGGIYNNLLLWFSRDMEETPEEMARIALSFCPENVPTLFGTGPDGLGAVPSFRRGKEGTA